MARSLGTRTALAAVTAIALGALAVAFAPAAGAATGSYLRLAHLSPDTPAVDVYVVSAANPQDQILLQGVGYGTLSEYQTVNGGTYTVSMRPAGADASTPPVISTTLSADEGAAYTVAGVGSFNDLGLTVLSDDLTLPPAGQSRVRVIQASASQPELDISVDGGPSLGEDVPFATTTDYSTVSAGEWTLRVDGGTGLGATLPLTVAAGAVYSVLILDESAGGLTVVTRVDALSSAGGGIIPAGGVETGAGGTATDDSGTAPAALAGVAAILVLTGLMALAFRRRAFATHTA
ncbi:MAG: DUF4397 domain-containing protein [Geodermatophilaceae bacterium]|nr:DUF4397 domain-containing protein [Geodermatophilaceae bacterium]